MTQIDSYRAAKQVVAEDLEGCIVFDALSDYDSIRKDWSASRYVH